jgi:hypothetical protein
VDRHIQDMIGDRPLAALLEVVADSGPVGEEMADRDGVGDERQVLAQEGPRGRREREGAVLDEAHDGRCGQPLRAARDAELRGGQVGDAVGAIGQAVRGLEHDLLRPVDPHDAGEGRLGRRPVDGVAQVVHDADAIRPARIKRRRGRRHGPALTAPGQSTHRSRPEWSCPACD